MAIDRIGFTLISLGLCPACVDGYGGANIYGCDGSTGCVEEATMKYFLESTHYPVVRFQNLIELSSFEKVTRMGLWIEMSI